MAQIVYFDGKKFIEPVVYSKIISGVINPPVQQEYGTVLIIDCGDGAGYGSGKGARTNGSDNTLQDFIYEVNSVQEILSHFKGGKWYDVAKKLYDPAPGQSGAKKTYIVHARDTVEGSLTLTFTDTKQLKFKTVDEGLIANGDITTVAGKLLKGYAVKLVAGTIDTSLFKLQFHIGTYKGKDTNNYEYSKDNAANAANNPQLIIESDEFDAFQDFIDWANANETFQEWFVLDPTSDDDGTVVTADLTLLAGFNVFAGGTENYSDEALANILTEIKELNYTFVICDEVGATTDSLLILSHIINETANYKKFLYVAGFDTKALRGNASSSGNTTSIGAAKLFNSQYANVVHGFIYEPDYLNESAFPTIKVQKGAIYKMAMLVGRKAGLLPNQTATYKTLGVVMEGDPLEDKNDRELFIQYGVIHTRRTNEGNVVNMDINTLQGSRNLNLFNDDGSSYQNSVMQIIEQVNKTIVANLTPKIIGQSRSTKSKAQVIADLNLELSGLSDQNLIISFQNSTAERKGSKWYLRYKFEADTPYDGVFSTGVIIDTGN